MYLVDENFVRSIPPKKKNVVFGKMKQLVEQLEKNNYDFSAIPYGASVRAVANTNLWKFRISRGDRIVFAFLSAEESDLKGLRPDSLDHHNLFFLKYCGHDEAIRYSHRVSTAGKYAVIMDDEEAPLPEIVDDGLDQYLYDWYCDYEYESRHTIIRVVPAADMGSLSVLDKEEVLYYLSDEQTEILKAPLPVFLYGCAGSGKTTLNIRELERLCLSENVHSIGYFTYSPLLRDEVRAGLNHILYTNGNQKEMDKISFWDFREFLSRQNKHAPIVHYEEFREWYDRSIRKKYDSFAVWREIRGIIKGMFGVDWEVDFGASQGKLMDRETYLAMGPQYSVFGNDEKREIYEIACQYQSWLDNKRKYDDNDLTMAILKQPERIDSLRRDSIIIDEIQDLTEKEIFLLYKLAKNPYCIFWSGDSNQTVNATYFQPHRLKSLFLKEHHEPVMDPERILTLNYRCAPPIVALANRIIELRRKALRKDKLDKKFDYTETAVSLEAVRSSKPVYLTYSEANEALLLSIISERHYAAVLVADSKTKERLQQQGYKHIYTVAEFKGIEREFILCYDIVTAHSAEWTRICNNDISKDDLYRFRYYFNQFYVAMTRARQGVCFLEHLGNPVYDQLAAYMVTTDSVELVTGQLQRQSTKVDYTQTAVRLEKAEQYEAAMEMYAQAEEQQGVERCKYLYEYQKGNYQTAAEGLFHMGEYKRALHIYEQIDDKKGIIQCRLMLLQDYGAILRFAGDDGVIWHAVFDSHNDELARAYLHVYNYYMEELLPQFLTETDRAFSKNMMNIKNIFPGKG